jgi:hypothetical protein
MKQKISIGSQDSQNSSHQIQYSHLYKRSWLFGTFKKQFRLISQKILLKKNYTIKGYQIAPKSVISFQKHQLGCFLSCKTKKTRLVILRV